MCRVQAIYLKKEMEQRLLWGKERPPWVGPRGTMLVVQSLRVVRPAKLLVYVCWRVCAARSSLIQHPKTNDREQRTLALAKVG